MNYYSTAFAPRRKTYKINELLIVNNLVIIMMNKSCYF